MACQSSRLHLLLSLAPSWLSLYAVLDDPGEKGEGPDPDTIQDYLEDALVSLGKAHVRPNNWRHRRFTEFLNEIWICTLKEGIPTNQHLFPAKFHGKIKKEHDHTSTTRKLISRPSKKLKSAAHPTVSPFEISATAEVHAPKPHCTRKEVSSTPFNNMNRPSITDHPLRTPVNHIHVEQSHYNDPFLSFRHIPCPKILTARLVHLQAFGENNPR